MLCLCATLLNTNAAPTWAASRARGEPTSQQLRGRAFTAPAPAALKRAAITKQKDGTLLIGGRSLRCGKNRNVLDRRLPNLGLAAPGVLVFNPRELGQWSDTVRLFVFHHECGHHKVGASELGSDCWAVKQGVRDGWLTREGLGQVCRSFGGGPATDTHPSGARRCGNIDRCFATATASLAKEKAAEAKRAEAKRAAARPAATPVAASAAAGPRLIQAPVLKRDGLIADSAP